MVNDKRRTVKYNQQKPITYGKQYIDESDINAVIEVLKSDFLTQGPKVEEFEKKFAKYVGSKYAVVFSTGTSALYAAVNALNLEEKSNILTTPMTFAASVNAIIKNKHYPVFQDIELETGNINLNNIENVIKKNNIKAALIVDFAGLPTDIDKLKNNNIKIITDACHSLGSIYKNKHTGSIADMTVFSFHPVKHITIGEGGMVTTNNKNYYEKLKNFRSHGIVKDKTQFKNPPVYSDDYPSHYYEMHDLSENYRVTDIQCALGISQLEKLPKFLEKRKKIAENYRKLLNPSKNFISFPKENNNSTHAYHLFFIHVNVEPFGITRDKLFNYLKSKNIFCQVHYLPVHLHPFYKEKFNFKKGDFKKAEEFYEKSLSIPIYYSLSNDEQQYVANCINDFFQRRLYAD